MILDIDIHDNEVPQNVLFQRLMMGDLRKIYNTPIKGSDCEELLSDLNILGTTGFWPELPLFAQAKNLGPITDDSVLPFPLDDKQLMIINRLCFHPEDEVMFITTGIGGSGKSTFLRCLNRLEDATSGEIEVDGYCISDKKININKKSID